MYRLRISVQVRYGHFREYFAQQEEMNELAKKRGWPEATYWVPTVGTGNDFIAEIDYPDLATFQRNGDEFGADEEAMNLVRSGTEHVVQGSVRTELFETAPHLA